MADNNKMVMPGSQRGKVIESGTMTIKGHLLRLPEIVIQISNISGIAESEVQLLNPGSFLMPIGLFMVVASVILNSWMLVIGILFLIVGYVFNVNAKRSCMNIYLNGGVTHSIIFSSQGFMNVILDRLSEIFENGGIVSQEFSISIDNCSFLGGAVVNPGTINN